MSDFISECALRRTLWLGQWQINHLAGCVVRSPSEAELWGRSGEPPLTLVTYQPARTPASRLAPGHPPTLQPEGQAIHVTPVVRESVCVQKSQLLQMTLSHTAFLWSSVSPLSPPHASVLPTQYLFGSYLTSRCLLVIIECCVISLTLSFFLSLFSWEISQKSQDGLELEILLCQLSLAH
jgi:hypothetical protein